jgi:flagellar motility protein MotE (MotC chaperone)
MRMPRLLPLVAVAAGGVLAINTIENGPGIVGAARSFAEGVARPGKPGGAAISALPADANAGPAAAQVVAAKPAPICAESPTELAKAAGLSPAELQVIQSLGARRGELDQREQGLSTELALIQAAETKVDAKIAAMNGLKADMQAMLGQLDQKQQAEVARLVKVYEDMKPQAAAIRFSLLTDEVRLPIAAQMKEQKLSAIIANMVPADAKHLTEALAARYVAQANAARQAINPTPAQAAAAPPAPKAVAPPAAAPPAQAAQAAPTAAPAAAEPAPKPKPAVHRKPRKPKAPAQSVATAAPPVAAPKGAPAPAAPKAVGQSPPAAKSAAAPAPPPKSATSPPPKSAAASPPPKSAAASPPPKPATPAAATPPPAKSAASTPAAPPPAKSG